MSARRRTGSPFALKTCSSNGWAFLGGRRKHWETWLPSLSIVGKAVDLERQICWNIGSAINGRIGGALNNFVKSHEGYALERWSGLKPDHQKYILQFERMIEVLRLFRYWFQIICVFAGGLKSRRLCCNWILMNTPVWRAMQRSRPTVALVVLLLFAQRAFQNYQHTRKYLPFNPNRSSLLCLLDKIGAPRWVSVVSKPAPNSKPRLMARRVETNMSIWQYLPNP